MKNFSTKWRSSKNPRKQRKYRALAPKHIRQKFVSSHLSKDLRKKHGKRNIAIKKGDKVKVMRGQFKKHEGKVERINLEKKSVFVSGIETTKKDGTKKLTALEPSNLMVIELDLDDKLRQKILERK